MSVHSYRSEYNGRRLSSRPGVGGITHAAHLTCGKCTHEGGLNLRVILPPDQIDKKFRQAGWLLDPHVCPGCRHAASKDKKAMVAKPSPAAMRAQLSMMTLLQTHFDVDDGVYRGDYSDARIARETGLAEALVSDFRRECFGDFKEPAPIRQLAADIIALDKMREENDAGLRAEVASLQTRLDTLRKRWAA